jgi:hypothetical protein
VPSSIVRAAVLSLLATLVYVAPVAAQAPRPGDTPRPGPGPKRPAIAITFWGGQQSATKVLTDRYAPIVNAEPASFESRYGSRGGSLLDVGGAVNLRKQLWVGAGFGQSNHSVTADVSGSIPHPFRFNTLRPISGTSPSLDRAQTAIHVSVLWRHDVSRKIDITGFAGPSWFTAKHDLIDDITYSESYPYETASYSSVTVSRQSAKAIGFNVGAAVTYALTRHIGVGGQVRHATASVTFDLPSGRQLDSTAGGTQMGAGVRLTF